MEDLKEVFSRCEADWSGREMLDRVRASLKARAEGRNEGGDILVMEYVDQIVKREKITAA